MWLNIADYTYIVLWDLFFSDILMKTYQICIYVVWKINSTWKTGLFNHYDKIFLTNDCLIIFDNNFIYLKYFSFLENEKLWRETHNFKIQL